MLVSLISYAAALPVASAQVQATASVRIERAALANKDEWEEAPKSSRREIFVRREGGEAVLVRVIEYE